MEWILPILGMHRAGTSLAARQLQRSGVFIGDQVLTGDISNPEGHFEDLEFLELHKEIFRRAGYTQAVRAPDSTLPLQEADYIRAQQLIQGRSQHKVWGWKDPRTCNCLALWLDVLPLQQCVFVVVVRPAEEVIASLLRRDYYNIVSRARWWKRPVSKRLFNRSLDIRALNYLDIWTAFYMHLEHHIISAGLRHFVVAFRDLGNPAWVASLADAHNIPLRPATVPITPSRLAGTFDYTLPEHTKAAARRLFIALAATR